MIDFDEIRERADSVIDTITEFLVNASETVIGFAEGVYEAVTEED